MEETIYFFASVGGSFWASCDPDAPGATQFGPTGHARPAQQGEAGLTWDDPGQTPWNAALMSDRVPVIPSHPEWDLLL